MRDDDFPVRIAGEVPAFDPAPFDFLRPRKMALWRSPVFAHGMLTMGLTGTMLTNWVGDGRLTSFGVRFVSQVWPGDTLTARATVEVSRLPKDALVEIDAIALIPLEE